MGSTAASHWTTLGVLAGGAITALAIARDAETPVLFIGSKTGLYRSGGFDGAAVHAWQRLPHAPLGVMALAVSPNFASDRALVVGTDSGIYRSRDGGDAWTPAQLPVSRSMVLALSYSPNYIADGILLAGTLEDGVWLSEDRAEHWSARSFGMLDATVLSIAISPNFAHDETVYIGTDTALYYSYNGTRAWKQLDFPETAAPILSLVLSPDFAVDGTVFAGTEHTGIFCSRNRGAAWEQLSVPATSINALQFANDGTLLAATESGVLLTADGGATWQHALELSDGISLTAHEGIALAGTADQGAWLTDDLSLWRAVELPPMRTVVGLALSPEFERGDPIGYIFGPQEGIWRTQDAGAAWELVHEGMPSLDAHALALSPRFAQDRTAVAALNEGLFISSDAGSTWYDLLAQPVSAVAFSPDGTHLAVARAGYGIQWTADLGTNWNDVPGPWEQGGDVLGLAMNGDLTLYVALREGTADIVSVWHGKPSHMNKAFSRVASQSTVVSFWVPRSEEHPFFYVGMGGSVWRISADDSAPVMETVVVSDTAAHGDVIALAGSVSASGVRLFACTSKRLFTLTAVSGWQVAHDFGGTPAVAFALSTQYPVTPVAYTLMLGGGLRKGDV